eukprot:TRINITY_DN4887_c0_g1_i1.p1 TRINITY_DN4887_c0_g1~~TRINITY_DN4887_c0_g1_i1.p1  ORF type:complete len:191 (-),score=20.13 TRINITY_DN4887_c0_g1_i1:235-807(-)
METPLRQAFPSVIERSYNRYVTDDQYVFIHQNGLCLVGIGSNHPLLTSNKVVRKITFKVGGQTFSHVEVVGKAKRGALPLSKNSVIAEVECEDGENFLIRSNVNGCLIEINGNLLQNPCLLTESPTKDGYVGIVRCAHKERSRISEEYCLLGLALEAPDREGDDEPETGLKRKREGSSRGRRKNKKKNVP